MRQKQDCVEAELTVFKTGLTQFRLNLMLILHESYRHMKVTRVSRTFIKTFISHIKYS